MRKTSLKQKLNLTTKTARQRLALVAVGIGLIGALIVLITRAASPSAVLEAETAVTTGNARSIEDPNASNGKALLFGQAAPNPNPGGGGASAGSVAWPLKVSANKRHLVDQNNKPFLFVADTAWTMIPYLSVADAKKLIDMRKAQGFNTILTNLVGWHRDLGGPNGEPFENGDVTRPVEAYWQAADQMIHYAKSQGMLLCVGPMPTGDNSGMNVGAMTTYGTWIGQRYKNQGNLMWYVGHDSPPSLDYEANSAEAAAIKAQIPDALISYHMEGLRWPGDNNAPNESWYGYYAMQWNGVESPYAHEVIRKMYDLSPARPALNIEPAYEPNNADPNGRNTTSPLDVRNQAWWSILAGSMGVVYGGPEGAWDVGYENDPNKRGPIPPDWGAIDRAPAAQVGHVGRILGQLQWEKLVPTGSDGFQSGIASDGSLMVYYIPDGGALNVGLSRLSGSGTAQWFDPVSGGAMGAAQTVLNSGSRTFTVPGVNAGGGSDWVLVIKKT